MYIYTGVFLYINNLKKKNMKTKPTYILLIESSDFVYTTFYKTIHYKYEINKNDFEAIIINEAKAVAFDLFSNPMHSDCEVIKITISKSINDDIIFELLERIDNEYYTSDNIKCILRDIILYGKTK